MEALVNSIWVYPLVFIAQFAQIFALVMNSKLMRDDRWVMAMLNSWTISVTQFAFVYIVAQTPDPLITFFVSASGASLGCGASHHFYTRIIMK